MAKFTYKGKTQEGTSVKETVEAADRYAVYEIARQNSHTVLTIEEYRLFSLAKIINLEKINYFLSRVKLDELVMITRNIGSMLKAGLPLSRALSVVERQSRNPRVKGIMVEVRESINKGNSFHDALPDYTNSANSSACGR